MHTITLLVIAVTYLPKHATAKDSICMYHIMSKVSGYSSENFVFIWFGLEKQPLSFPDCQLSTPEPVVLYKMYIITTQRIPGTGYNNLYPIMIRRNLRQLAKKQFHVVINQYYPPTSNYMYHPFNLYDREDPRVPKFSPNIKYVQISFHDFGALQFRSFYAQPTTV